MQRLDSGNCRVHTELDHKDRSEEHHNSACDYKGDIKSRGHSVKKLCFLKFLLNVRCIDNFTARLNIIQLNKLIYILVLTEVLVPDLNYIEDL